MKTVETYVFRVKPDQELAEAVKNYCKQNNISSAVITGIIGSLRSVELGFLKELPGKYITRKFEGPIEIVAAQGSIALCEEELIAHVHLLISDEKNAVGGHLVTGTIFSTAEVVLQELDGQLRRKTDDYTGLKELI